MKRGGGEEEEEEEEEEEDDHEEVPGDPPFWVACASSSPVRLFAHSNPSSKPSGTAVRAAIGIVGIGTNTPHMQGRKRSDKEKTHTRLSRLRKSIQVYFHDDGLTMIALADVVAAVQRVVII